MNVANNGLQLTMKLVAPALTVCWPVFKKKLQKNIPIKPAKINLKISFNLIFIFKKSISKKDKKPGKKNRLNAKGIASIDTNKNDITGKEDPQTIIVKSKVK